MNAAPMGVLGLLAAVLALGVAADAAVARTRRRSALHHVAPPADGDRSRHDRGAGHLVALVPAPPVWVATRLRRAGLTAGGADHGWRAGLLGAGAAVAIAAVAGGPGAAVLAALVLVLVTVLVAVAVGDRAAVLVDRELPAVLATVAAGVRSGASLTVAVCEGACRARGPAAEDLMVVADSLATGHGLVEVLDRWVRSRPTAGVRMTGAALALAAETGGAGAQTIDGVAATLRDRLAVDRELAALSSQARASAVVIGLGPIAFVVLTAISDPGVWDFFLRSPAGLACLGAGCLLDAFGAGWMTLVARSVR